MNFESLVIEQKVWLMVNNKPVELIVSKIISTNEIKQGQTTIALASYSEQYNHEHTINPKETFETAEQLQEWLFNFKR